MTRTFHVYMLSVVPMWWCKTVRRYVVIALIGRIRYVTVSQCHTSSIQSCQYLPQTIEAFHQYNLLHCRWWYLKTSSSFTLCLIPPTYLKYLPPPGSVTLLWGLWLGLWWEFIMFTEQSYLAFTALWADFLLNSHDIPFPMILHWPAANWGDIGETLSVVVGGGDESPSFPVVQIILAELLSIIRPELPCESNVLIF